MNHNFIAKHWYASVYEQFETYTHDIEFLLGILKEQNANAPQNILEVACGGGRICIPLAKAGYNVTGFDVDEHMLLLCYHKMQGLKNIRCFAADATTTDWGKDFDIVIMAGNILINIESDMDYAEAQANFISKAASSLRAGGHLYLDFDLHFNPSSIFNSLRESSYFKGIDDMGTIGKTVSYGSVYDPITQICSGTNHSEMITNNGEQFIIPKRWYKHIPTQLQVYNWLEKAGLVIEKAYKNFTNEPLSTPIDESTKHATIWAYKK